MLDALTEPSVLWLEAPIEHFEPKEHLLVQVLAEAAIEDALRTMARSPDQWADAIKSVTILQLYTPSSVALPLEAWAQSHSGAVRHVRVHRLEPDRPLPPQTLREAQTGEFLWVVGGTGPLAQNCHGKWLTNAEMGRLAELSNSELWVRSNCSGKSLAMRLRTWHQGRASLTCSAPKASHRRRMSSG